MIYFIQATESKRIKIGFSASSPAKRLSSMQTGNHEQLVLLFTLDGGHDREYELQNKYDAYRIRGEWFRCESDLKDFVERNTPKTEPVEQAVQGEDFLNDNPRYAALYHALSSSDSTELTLQLYNEDSNSYKEYFPHGHWTATKWRAEFKAITDSVKSSYSAVQEFEKTQETR